MGLEDIRYWWEDLELRKKLEENQSIVIVGLLVIILFSLGLVTCQLLGGGKGSFSREAQLVYFDLTNQTVKIVDHEYPAIPKTPLEGTDDVFMARIYSCEEKPEGSLKDGMTLADLKTNGMFVAWLERVDPNATDDIMLGGEGREFRTVEHDRWYQSNGPGFNQLMKALHERCPQVYECRP